MPVRRTIKALLVAATVLLAATPAAATIVTDWNNAALAEVRAAKLGPPIVARALAIAHTCSSDEPQQRPHFVDREAERSRTPDEGQARDVLEAVEPIATRASCGSAPQTKPFVVTDRLDTRPGLLCEPADRDSPRAIRHLAASRKKGLESGVTTEFTVLARELAGGDTMAELEIKTADELGTLGLEDRWKTRRAVRETDLAGGAR